MSQNQSYATRQYMITDGNRPSVSVADNSITPEKMDFGKFIKYVEVPALQTGTAISSSIIPLTHTFTDLQPGIYELSVYHGSANVPSGTTISESQQLNFYCQFTGATALSSVQSTCLRGTWNRSMQWPPEKYILNVTGDSLTVQNKLYVYTSITFSSSTTGVMILSRIG